MKRVYRVLAIALILIGLFVAWQSISATVADVLNSDSHPYAIRCDGRGCRSILPDGSLADDSIAKPEGTR